MILVILDHRVIKDREDPRDLKEKLDLKDLHLIPITTPLEE